MKRKTMILYSIGSIGEGTGYNIFICFFIYFLTTVAGVPPAAAGTISLIGMLWDAVTDPIIGFFSDKSTNRFGRRRGYILVGSISLFFVMSLIFWDWPGMSVPVKIAYFTGLNILFWLAYTIADVPYLSLGNEVAKSYEERSIIRGAAYTCCNIGYLLGQPLVLPMVALFSSWGGGSEINGWRMTGIAIALVTAFGYLVAFLGTKEHDFVNKEKQSEKFSDIIRQYYRILRGNRSLCLICLLTFFVNIAIGLYLSLIMFLFQFNFALSSTVISAIMLGGNVAAIFLSPIVGGLAAKYDKRSVMIVGLVIYAAGMLIVKILPVGLLSAILVNLMLYAGNTVFFSQVYSFAYDCTEINRFHLGEANGGSATALVGLSYKIGTAIGMQISGLGLELSGFVEDAAVQSGSALSAIENMFSIVSGSAVILGLVIFLFYPLTKQRLLRLKEANDNKEKGLPFDSQAVSGL